MSSPSPGRAPSEWQRVKDLYFEAASLTLEARLAFLESRCPPDDPAHEELRKLLETDTPADFLGKPVIAARPVTLPPGTLLGHYNVQAQLGSGGAGVVYRAEDTRLHRTVAVKVLRQALAGDPQSESRFTREAELASSLNHPNIVTIHEIGSEGGTSYIVMEHVAGRSLAQMISSRGMPVPQALGFASQIAAALATAHEHGITHRDLKPGNIMVTPDGRVKVLDFGLARRSRSTPAESQEPNTVTTPGDVVGTFGYMSPEQVRGEQVDQRSDVFSFGSVLYEMLSGAQPFADGSNIATAAAVLHLQPAPLRQVPPEIEQLALACLQKDRALRWQSMLDARMIIDQALSSLGRPPVAQAVPAPVSRWRRGLVPAAAFAAGAALVGAAIWRPGGQPAPAALTGKDTMITADAGLSAYPALSQDGTLIAYASDRAGGGNLDIWVQQVRGGEPIRLTQHEADDSDPDISPDRTRIAFRSERDGGGVYVVPALGGNPALLVPGCRNPRFSPDGNWVACWTGREGTGGYAPGSAKVLIVPSGGGELKEIHSEFGAAMFPAWSPDGRGLLVLGRSNASEPLERSVDWWYLSVADSRQQPKKTNAIRELNQQGLRSPMGQIQMVPSVWTAKPSRVLFSAALGDSTNVWQIPIDLKTGSVGGPAGRLTAGTGLDVHAAAVGGTIVYSSLALNIDIWALPLDAERGTPAGTIYPLTRQTSIEDYPSLSLDGRRLAFISRRSGTWFLRIRDLTGDAEKTLLSSNSPLLVSQLSGDGTRLAYSDFEDNIYTVGADGGPVQRLCGACGIPTGLSIDGSYALMEPVDPPEHVFLLDTRSKEKRTAIQTSGSPGSTLSEAKPSPDGRWIAFRGGMGELGKSRIFIAPVDSQRPAESLRWLPVTETKTEDRSPAWSPKGDLLYFLSDRDGFRCIWAQALDAQRHPAGKAFSVQHFHHANLSLKRIGDRTEIIGLSVASRLLVFATGELSGNIWSRQL